MNVIRRPTLQDIEETIACLQFLGQYGQWSEAGRSDYLQHIEQVLRVSPSHPVAISIAWRECCLVLWDLRQGEKHES